jgi:hypothetical protein
MRWALLNRRASNIELHADTIPVYKLQEAHYYAFQLIFEAVRFADRMPDTP